MQHIGQSVQFYEVKFGDQNQKNISGNGQDWLPPPGRWVKPKSIKVIYEKYDQWDFCQNLPIGCLCRRNLHWYFVFFFVFFFLGGGGGVGGGLYTCEMIPKTTDMIIFLRLLLFLHWKLVSILFYSRERNLLLKREKKMQRHHTRLHLRKWKSTSQANSSFKANPPCFNVRMLITREIIGQ